MLQNAKILVADDDAELLRVVAESLEASGAAVVCAASGAELMEALADEGPFALVVTDVSMPWMDGLQAMFSARHAGLSTPVLVMTGLNDEGVASRIRALEPKVSLLRKPFDLAALTRAAERLLATYPPGAQGGPADFTAAPSVTKGSEAPTPSIAGASVQWLENLFDLMAEAIVLVDAEGHVAMANRPAKAQFFETFGDPKTDAPLTLELRRPSGERLLPEDVQLEATDESPARASAREGAAGLLLRCADGTIVPVLVSATPIRMEGQRTGMVLVLERAPELSDDDAGRSEWATAIAHDLRQPINSIMLTSDLLLQGNMEDDQRQHLLRVRSSAKRLSRMVGDMTKLAGQSSHH